MSPSLRSAFDHARDLTVAAEEELLLVDADTLDLRPAAPELLARLNDPDRFRAEISPAQLEIATGVCRTSWQVSEQLAEARRAAVIMADGRVRLAGVGAHPFARPWSDIGPAPRYAALLEEHQLGIRLGALAAGLHVHVGVAGAERALAVYNQLRGLMPLLVAVSANAPFIAGVDSGLATVRCTLANALPRHGTSPPIADWDAFEHLIGWGITTGAVPDASTYWWDCRLNVRTGTVEVRAPDAQASLADAEALTAIVHAAAADACGRHDAGAPPPLHDTAAIDENRWRAARYGLDAELVDLETGSMAPVRRLCTAVFERLAEAAERCDAAGGIELARHMLETDTPDELRRIARSDGLRAVCALLADRTEAA